MKNILLLVVALSIGCWAVPKPMDKVVGFFRQEKPVS